MTEYVELIRKEKDEALLEFSEDTFRQSLDSKIAEKKRPRRSYVSFFRRPAVAGTAVFFMIFLVWLTSRLFLLAPLGSEEKQIQNTFVQLFSQHGTILDRMLQPIEQESNRTAMYEFQWTVKRIIYAIQKENAREQDISESLNRVLQNAAVLIKAGKGKPGEWNI